MNLVTILIPFLLFSASFVSLAAIDSSLPAISPTPTPPSPDQPLELSIEITHEGYALAASRPLELGRRAQLRRSRTVAGVAAWPAASLTEVLADIKERFPQEDTVILGPAPSIPYEVVVHTMDAARADGSRMLFPSVVMSGGAP